MRVPLPVLVSGLLMLLLATPLPAPAVSADPSLTAEPHPSITIDSDLAFGDLFTGVRSGTGTAVDPYVISDWSIHKTASWGIRLSDTRAHVVIRDVYIHGATGPAGQLTSCFPPVVTCTNLIGIWLERAHNVTIERVRLVIGDQGIRLDAAEDITVRDVTFGAIDTPLGGFEYGVYLRHARRVHMDALIVEDTRWAIATGSSTDLTVQHSTFQDSEIGLGFGDFAERITLRDNRFLATPVYAFGAMRDLLVTGNTFGGTAVGLGSGGYPTTSFERLHVCGNTFTGHGLVALEVPRGQDIRIEGNRFAFNHNAVRVASAVLPPLAFDDNTVTRSTGTGVDLRVPMQTLRDNQFERNPDGHILAAPATNALDNWWGHASGPSGIGPGSGDRLQDLGAGTAFSPWLVAPPTAGTTCP